MPKTLTLPSETEIAWAEHAVRERIATAYLTAVTRADKTAARWEAYAYDLANPGTSSLVDQLAGHECDDPDCTRCNDWRRNATAAA